MTPDVITVLQNNIVKTEVAGAELLAAVTAGDRAATAADRTATAADRAAAAAAASAAATASNGVVTARDQAIAAASSAGPITIYDTKAAATAALAGIATNAVIEVMVDESQGGVRTRYRKESGALVFKLALPTYVVDSLDPERSYGMITAPFNGTTGSEAWKDNVLGVQNESVKDFGGGVLVSGNAAINFYDAAGTERAAVGYSWNPGIATNGYYPRLLYCEIGNPFTTDDAVTDFAVVTTIKAGGPFWGGAAVNYKAIEVVGQNGNIFLRANGAEVIAEDTLRVGSVGAPRQINYAMTTTQARMRERGTVDQFAIGTNVFDMGVAESAPITRDNAALPSWIMSMGGGLNLFKISHAPVGIDVPVEIVRIDNDARMQLNQTVPGAGADGQFAVSSAGLTPITARQNSGFAGTPCTILYNTATTGDNVFAAFATEGSYTQRGSINYNRGAGLVSYNTTSDYRAKDIKGANAGALERILAVKTYQARMHGADQDIAAVIAHELAQSHPYAVTGEKDAEREMTVYEGDEPRSGMAPVMQEVNLAALIPDIIAAVQELAGRLPSKSRG